MTNGNGYSWIIKFFTFLAVLVVAAVGAPIWIEARIASQVQYEAGERKAADDAEADERKAADIAVESRQEQRMIRIETKLDNIDEYIRELD